MDVEVINMIPKSIDSVLVVVDIQEKMAAAMQENTLAEVIKNTAILIQAARELNIPVLLTEQYSKGLGQTCLDIQTCLEEYNPIEKLTFSCYREMRFRQALESVGRRQVILCGIETHVCLYQTAPDLLQQDYLPFLVADAVCSRSVSDHEIALQGMRHAGVAVVSTEMLLFQLLQVAGTPVFKTLSKLIK